MAISIARRDSLVMATAVLGAPLAPPPIAVVANSNAMDTIYCDGYAGLVSAAASAVVANYTVVDTFASVATGNSTPGQAAKAAASQAARYCGKA